MQRLDLLLRGGIALVAASSLALAGCQQTTQSVQDAAKDAATGAAQTALAPAVNPVLDLLKKSEADVKAGNLNGALAAMGGFKGLWDKAAPAIRPLAGDQWPAIETAANTVLQTFASGATPDAAGAGAALSGLIGPLSGLIGK
jgi:hypothetical protein